MKTISAAILVAATFLQGAPVAAKTPMKHYPAPAARGTPLPFSSAVRVGDTLYLSGQIGLRPDGTLPDGIEAQARQVMDNIASVLAAGGAGWDDVFKCTVMIENMAEWAAFNAVYVTYFKPGALPARSAFGADGLAMGALVEVECMARAGGG
ncbi:RidA family protein [Allosphingosinicella deserti]|uniref:Enamine deaminase RidA n=1 Tax=Allosphingosinicella deserti TaxID=2116704 RepID=A0A2P7QRQ9_9SPHN|nr:RidA family protein [Sphingomonas deserti]PSJ40663.1 enamine deaminase RidA [Sphingomonas deserti]